MCAEIVTEKIGVDLADGITAVERNGASLTRRLTHCHTSRNYAECTRRLRLRRDRSARDEEVRATLGNE